MASQSFLLSVTSNLNHSIQSLAVVVFMPATYEYIMLAATSGKYQILGLLKHAYSSQFSVFVDVKFNYLRAVLLELSLPFGQVSDTVLLTARSRCSKERKD